MISSSSRGLQAACRRTRGPHQQQQLRGASLHHQTSTRSAHRASSSSCRALPPRAEDDDLLMSAGCPVPLDQQPLNELKQLQDMFLFDWATMPVGDYARKLATVYGLAFGALALPVSAVTFNISRELPQCLAAASVGSSFVVTVLVWRLYLGWQHVGDRLISATVEYEETGWYDGQTWVKTPQVLMRDRLMSNYTVKPALARLKRTLLGLGGALVASLMLLAVLPPPPVNSATSAAAYDGSGSPYAYTSSSSSSGSRYVEETVAKYEPWAVADGDEGGGSGSSEEAGDQGAPAYDMRSHMLLQQ